MQESYSAELCEVAPIDLCWDEDNNDDSVSTDVYMPIQDSEHSPFYLCSFLESSEDDLSESPTSEVGLGFSIYNNLDGWTASSTNMPMWRVSHTPKYCANLNVTRRRLERTPSLAHIRASATINDLKFTISPVLRSTASRSTIGSRPPQAGYTGQFRLILPCELNQVGATALIFGDWLHPNGELFHSRFISDSYNQRTRPTKYQLETSTLFRVAEEMAQLASSQTISKEEGDLRRQGHYECAAAQLEGVPVGYWRYHQGHLMVDEYVRAGMCVCWRNCFCNRLCSGFGDLICPCNEYLEQYSRETHDRKEVCQH